MEAALDSRNIGLDLARVTEAAALAAGRWIGSGNFDAAHAAATEAMYNMLVALGIGGCVAIGEDRIVDGKAALGEGVTFGMGQPLCDLAVDPIDGTQLLIEGKPGAVSVIAVAPRHSIWSAGPAEYLDKIVVDRDAAHVLVPECMDAPAAWTLALIARAKKKAVRDLVVVVLQRLRHHELIEEIRATGARIYLRQEGDAEGALEAAMPGTGVDILLGIGGASQGVLAACAVRALGGGMLARLAPQSAEERAAITQSGMDSRKIYTVNELVASDDIFFAATGLTGTPILPGISYKGSHAETHSLLIRAKTRTRRFIQAEYALES
ncbi:MAG: fructose-bisphosphatase class II family protein [Candidatus Promineofilum sp.]|nr:fructose-bisphosphatase class II family protein [Promineifilum sp.]